MNYLENKVKEAFIEIYFKDINYVITLHQQLILQIKSAAQVETDPSGREYIIEKGNKDSASRYEERHILIPELPPAFTNEKINKYFINGLLKSKYFIG